MDQCVQTRKPRSPNFGAFPFFSAARSHRVLAVKDAHNAVPNPQQAHLRAASTRPVVLLSYRRSNTAKALS